MLRTVSIYVTNGGAYMLEIMEHICYNNSIYVVNNKHICYKQWSIYVTSTAAYML